MKASVQAAFVEFTSPLEGVCPFLYLDSLGLVTTAIGNLVDTSQSNDPVPWRPVLGLPFVHKDGTPATTDEIIAEWKLVKSHQEMKTWGGGHFDKVTTLRLTPEGVAKVVLTKLSSNDISLRRHYTNFDAWPADAQLATHSMAWACGAAFGYGGPRPFRALDAALQAMDFEMAARECHINTDGPDGKPGTADDLRGIIPRNAANKLMYLNAARVLAYKLDPEELHWPKEVPDLNNMPTPVDSIAPVDIPIVHPDVPLDRPALDGDLPNTPGDGNDQGA